MVVIGKIVGLLEFGMLHVAMLEGPISQMHIKPLHVLLHHVSISPQSLSGLAPPRVYTTYFLFSFSTLNSLTTKLIGDLSIDN